MNRRSRVLTGGELLAPATRVAVIMGASLGGPRELAAGLVRQLIDVEKRGLHIVLVAGSPADAHGNVAAIARTVYVADAALADSLRPAWGAERVVRGDSLEPKAIARALRALPIPESRTWRRRIYNRVKGRR